MLRRTCVFHSDYTGSCGLHMDQHRKLLCYQDFIISDFTLQCSCTFTL